MVVIVPLVGNGRFAVIKPATKAVSTTATEATATMIMAVVLCVDIYIAACMVSQVLISIIAHMENTTTD